MKKHIISLKIIWEQRGLFVLIGLSFTSFCNAQFVTTENDGYWPYNIDATDWVGCNSVDGNIGDKVADYEWPFSRVLANDVRPNANGSDGLAIDFTTDQILTAEKGLLTIKVSNVAKLKLISQNNTLIIRRYFDATNFIDYTILDQLFYPNAELTYPYFRISLKLTKNFIWISVGRQAVNSSSPIVSGPHYVFHTPLFFGMNFNNDDIMDKLLSYDPSVSLYFENAYSENINTKINARLYGFSTSKLVTNITDCYINKNCSTTSSTAKESIVEKPSLNPIKIDDFKVFPNPVKTGLLNIEIPENKSNTFKIKLVSLNGAEVLTREVKNEQKKSRIVSVDVSTLSDGMYILNVFGDVNNMIWTQKIIKSNY